MGTKINTDTSSTVTTTTNTELGDVGLTGAAGVELARALTAGAVSISGQATKTLETLTQAAGKSYNNLIGGAGQLVKTQESLIKGDSSDPASMLIKNAPLLLLFGLGALYLFRKG